MDWADCPIRFDVIEQVVLARNWAQHGGYLSSLIVPHDSKTLRKHPQPFFANEDELKIWTDAGAIRKHCSQPKLEDFARQPVCGLCRDRTVGRLD